MSEIQHTQRAAAPSGYGRIYSRAVIGTGKRRPPVPPATDPDRGLDLERPHFELHGETLDARLTGPQDYLAARGREVLSRIQRGKSLDFARLLTWDYSPRAALLHILERDWVRWAFDQHLAHCAATTD